jgi:hypothetical protein
MKITIEIKGTDDGIGSNELQDIITYVGLRFGVSEEIPEGQICQLGELVEGHPTSYTWES